MINSATKYCEREADDHPSVGRSQKISANAVMTITLMCSSRLSSCDPTPNGPVRKPGFTRGGSIAATAFEDEVAAASRERWCRPFPAPSITTDVDGPNACASAGSWHRTLIACTSPCAQRWPLP
jgi:hypothetical protein